MSEDFLANDAYLPAQMSGPAGVGKVAGAEQQLALDLLVGAWRDVGKFAGASTGHELTRIVNLIAWAEDVDGERARRYGVPYRATLAQVAMIAGLEPAAVASGLRRGYRAGRVAACPVRCLNVTHKKRTEVAA